MLRGAQTVANRDKTSTRVSRQDCQKTTQDECQKTSLRNRAEQYWTCPRFLPVPVSCPWLMVICGDVWQWRRHRYQEVVGRLALELQRQPKQR